MAGVGSAAKEFVKGVVKGTAKGAATLESTALTARQLEVAEAKFWTRHETHELLGQTNKVYKRDDLIDLSRVDPKTRLTNTQRMERGMAPICSNNQPINLHHMLQTEKGALAEVTQSFHQKHSKAIHINDNSIPSGIDRAAFDKWRSEYWKQRVVELEGVSK